MDENMEKDTIIEKWEEILSTVKMEYELSDVSFKTWIKPLSVHSLENNVLMLLGPTEPMGLNYVSKRYLSPLKVAIAELTGIDCEIKFLLPDQIKEKTSAKPLNSAMNENIERANLNPKYTFDTFVVGSNNNFAHAAALAVAESPGAMYNPLFIYGGVGLGKTHLMHSIAHFILEHNPDSKVLYVTSEYFTNELIEAIRNGNNTAMAQFREKYRNIDVLLIDDVQFLIGKESTQEEFFHTFNDLHGSKKQIILSSDKPPKDFLPLESRLRSRFEWGLIADISSPDYETRMAILRKKEELDGYTIDDDVIKYIATHIKSNIRELEGALNKIMAFSNLEHREIDIYLAEEALKDIIAPEERGIVTPQLILNKVAEHFSIDTEDLIGNKRTANIVFPRQIAMYLCNEMLEMPFKNIGEILGKRDHTTIMHGSKKIAKELQTSESLKNTIEILKKKISPA